MHCVYKEQAALKARLTFLTILCLETFSNEGDGTKKVTCTSSFEALIVCLAVINRASESASEMGLGVSVRSQSWDSRVRSQKFELGLQVWSQELRVRPAGDTCMYLFSHFFFLFFLLKNEIGARNTDFKQSFIINFMNLKGAVWSS